MEQGHEARRQTIKYRKIGLNHRERASVFGNAFDCGTVVQATTAGWPSSTMTSVDQVVVARRRLQAAARKRKPFTQADMPSIIFVSPEALRPRAHSMKSRATGLMVRFSKW